MKRSAIEPAAALRHPLWWLSLGVLLLNDHFLKGAELLPAGLTGKLSDVAGLVVAPVVVAVLIAARRRVSVLRSVWAVAFVFSLINLWPPAARAFETLTGALGVRWQVYCDPTDLLALPALLLAWRLMHGAGRDDARGPWGRRFLVERTAIVLGSLACLASGAPSSVPIGHSRSAVIAGGGPEEPLFVIDAASGRPLAHIASRGRIGSSISYDGVLYTVGGRRVGGARIADGRQVLAAPRGALYYDVISADALHLYLVARPERGERSAHLVALDRLDGSVRWRSALPGPVPARWQASQRPLVASGVVVALVEERLVGYRATDGKALWRIAGSSPLRWSVASGATACVGSDDGVIYAVDLEHGKERWRYRASEASFRTSPWGSRLGVAAGALIFVEGHRLIALESTSGAVRWRGPDVSEVVFAEEVAFARSRQHEDQYLIIDLETGAERWRRTLGEKVAPPFIADASGLVLVRPAAARVLSALELATGTERWRFDLSDGKRATAKN